MNREQRRAAGYRGNADPALEMCEKHGIRPDQRVWLAWGIRDEHHHMRYRIHECAGREVFGRTALILKQDAQEPVLFTTAPNMNDNTNWLPRLLRETEAKGWGYDTDVQREAL